MEECKPMRQKYWGECSQEEKIERLADFIYRGINQNQSLQSGLNEFARHRHMPDGEIVLKRQNGGVLGNSDKYNHDMLRREKE